MRIDSKTFNVVQLGVGFFLLFFAVNAQLAIIEIIVDTKHKEGVVDEHAGYVRCSRITRILNIDIISVLPLSMVYLLSLILFLLPLLNS